MPLQQDPFNNLVSVSFPDDDDGDTTADEGGGANITHWKANKWLAPPSSPGEFLTFATFSTKELAKAYIDELIALDPARGGGGIFLGYQPPASGLWNVALELSQTIDGEHPNGYGFNPFTGTYLFYMISPGN